MINNSSQNPFDILSLATGEGLFGRGDELDWLMNGIKQQARLLLFGEEGMGKSSLLEQAGKSLGQQSAGWMIRLDLSLHRSSADLAGALGQANNQLQRLSGNTPHQGVLGDAGKRPSREQSLPPKSSSTAGREGRPDDFMQKLNELNAFALSQKRPVVIVVDSCHEMGRFGGEHFESTLMAAVENHSAMAYTLCGDGHGSNPASLGMQRLQGGFNVHHLGQLDPRAFAQHIDKQFQSAGIVTRGVGAACVDCAASNTAQTVELAQRTFNLSFQARFANEATVKAALGQAVDTKKDHFAQVWSGLSPNEHNIMRRVAKAGGEGLLGPDAHSQSGLQTDEQARAAIHSLVDKRLLDPAGPTGVKMHSAAMKQWTLQAQVSFAQENKIGGGSTQQLSFSLSFQRSNSASKAQSPSP